jgi:hypothetical protein
MTAGNGDSGGNGGSVIIVGGNGVAGGSETVTIVINSRGSDSIQVTGNLSDVAGITPVTVSPPANPAFAMAGDPNATTSQTLYTTPGVDILQGGGNAGDVLFVNATGPDGWAEIDNMHAGDLVAILGFQVGQSALTWANATDPNGQTGATAQVSLQGNGKIDAQITFAGVDANTAQHWTESNYSLNGVPFLSLSA